jgi:hypothetical protein
VIIHGGGIMVMFVFVVDNNVVMLMTGMIGGRGGA